MRRIDESRERRRDIFSSFEEKKKRLDYSAKPSIRRMMLDYDRYSEAGQIIEALEKRGEDVSKMHVLDYGCGAGDYGFAFGRQGATVTFCDISPETLEFMEHRWAAEGRTFVARFAPTPLDFASLGDVDVVIFGEVLEHVHEPLEILAKTADQGATYIFTSSYPYRSDDATNDYWRHGGHDDHARLAQPACRELLETRYKKAANFGGQLNLWRRRD